MSKFKKSNIDRSHNFGGHLNKKWIVQDLPRYQLAYEELDADLFKNVKVLKNLAVNLQNVEDTLCTLNMKLEVGSNLHKYPLFKSVLLEKIILHYSSGKLLQSPSNSTIIDLAFSTIACQTPTQIHSRKSIAGFKLSKFALLGAKTTLRNLAKYEFYYKFYFLGASQTQTYSTTNLQHTASHVSSLARPVQSHTRIKTKRYLQEMQGGRLRIPVISSKTKSISTTFPVKNVFVFNELDNLDYDAFSNLAGLEIQFVNRNLPLLAPNFEL